jgi:hypothetical protein
VVKKFVEPFRLSLQLLLKLACQSGILAPFQSHPKGRKLA